MLNDLKNLSRAELSAIYFHTENLLFRGFQIQSVRITRNEKFFVVTITSYNNMRKLNRVRNHNFFTEQELNDFLEILSKFYTFTVSKEV